MQSLLIIYSVLGFKCACKTCLHAHLSLCNPPQHTHSAGIDCGVLGEMRACCRDLLVNNGRRERGRERKVKTGMENWEDERMCLQYEHYRVLKHKHHLLCNFQYFNDLNLLTLQADLWVFKTFSSSLIKHASRHNEASPTCDIFCAFAHCPFTNCNYHTMKCVITYNSIFFW